MRLSIRMTRFRAALLRLALDGYTTGSASNILRLDNALMLAQIHDTIDTDEYK